MIPCQNGQVRHRLVFLLLAIVLAACSPPTIDELHGHRSLRALEVDGEVVDLTPVEYETSIRFNQFTNEIDGIMGCNDIHGSFTYEDGQLQTKDVFQSIVGCSIEADTIVDLALGRLLSGPILVSGNSDEYVLSGSGVRATFVRLED